MTCFVFLRILNYVKQTASAAGENMKKANRYPASSGANVVEEMVPAAIALKASSP